MTLDADDADLLDQTVTRIAADLRDLGDTTSRDTRRATAVGILADPQHALDLMTGRTDQAAAETGGDVDLVVHLTPTDLTADHGVGVEETRGAVSTRPARRLGPPPQPHRRAGPGPRRRHGREAS